MKYCVIFGTGSIAKRHAKILNQKGIKCIAVSRSSKKKDKVFHKIINYEEFPKYDPHFWLICFPTSLHKKVCIDIINKSKNKKPIYCEKPGPNLIKRNYRIFVLYNLRYLKFLSKLKRNKKNFFHFVHKANAKEWPSNENWKNRYMFVKELGGGALKTNSHELDLYYFLTGNKKVYVKKKYMRDKNGKKIDYFYEAHSSKNDLKIESSIIEKNAIRYIMIFNKLDKKIELNYVFYDKNKKVKIDNKLIQKTYIDMWKSLLEKRNVLLPKAHETSWILDL